MAARQKTVSPEDNYNVLNRENNTNNNLDQANNPSNISEYDLLNHSKRASLVENFSANLYHTTDPVFIEANHENTYDTACQSNLVYSSVNVGNNNSSAIQGPDNYSMATQIDNNSEANQTNVYSSANLHQEAVYSCAEQIDDECNTATEVTTLSRSDTTNDYYILDQTNIHIGTD